MDMTALFDSGDTFADVMSIFDNGIAGLNRRQRNFVANGNSIKAFHFYCFIALHDPAGQHLPFLDAFNDDNANRVFFFVNKKMRSGQWNLPGMMKFIFIKAFEKCT